MALAEVLHAWRKGSGAKGSAASLMSLASAFEPASSSQQPAGLQIEGSSCKCPAATPSCIKSHSLAPNPGLVASGWDSILCMANQNAALHAACKPWLAHAH